MFRITPLSFRTLIVGSEGPYRPRRVVSDPFGIGQREPLAALFPRCAGSLVVLNQRLELLFRGLTLVFILRK